MSDYSQSFELDKEEDNVGVKDKQEKPTNFELVEHRLRLSIDIHSIKEHDFRGNIYARYQSVVKLNIKQFKSAPPIVVTKPRVEEKFSNSFRSYTFDCASAQLPDRLQCELEIELWHQDRLKKDVLIGITKYPLINLMKGQVRKTSQSYAKVCDSYLPVDEVDEERKPIKKIGEVRVIFYLEDLGPKDQIVSREKQLGLNRKEEVKDLLEGEENEKEQDYPAVMLPEKNDIFGDLEFKIIWELENWKKTEESRFKIQLKQKEMEFIANLSEEWKKKEFEKEKIFKKIESSMNQLYKKVKEKATELQKREQKIVILEEEVKSRIMETSRQIANKEEEINQLKRKLKDEKGNSEKEKTMLTIQFEALKEENSALRKEYEKFKREQDNSPISLVKNELKDKMLEIKELKKEIQKSNEIRDQYKVYYEKIRGELLKSKKQYDMLKDETHFKNNAEIEALRQEVQQLKQMKENIQPNLAAISNPFKKNALNMQGVQGQEYAYSNGGGEGQMPDHYEEYNWEKDNMGELESLIYHRDYLLSQGGYFDTDPLIIQLNNQIKAKQM